jgi:hypothetical protein
MGVCVGGGSWVSVSPEGAVGRRLPPARREGGFVGRYLHFGNINAPCWTAEGWTEGRVNRGWLLVIVQPRRGVLVGYYRLPEGRADFVRGLLHFRKINAPCWTAEGWTEGRVNRGWVLGIGQPRRGVLVGYYRLPEGRAVLWEDICTWGISMRPAGQPKGWTEGRVNRRMFFHVAPKGLFAENGRGAKYD